MCIQSLEIAAVQLLYSEHGKDRKNFQFMVTVSKLKARGHQNASAPLLPTSGGHTELGNDRSNTVNNNVNVRDYSKNQIPWEIGTILNSVAKA